ncbi:hypothetical protein [Methylosinus sp. LW4]|uniref:hypothetical protein n=1 Tax=Methylosinus sp. LW4 TaxID=136993 RepID=UPI0005BC7542|nr:hypothetical protein [Methylosinus sp. LW4]
MQQRLDQARAEVARLEREIAAAPCAEVGHRWKHLGGKHAGCADPDCMCSVPVYECEACGNCDYGENDEAREIIARCEEKSANG